MQIITEPYKNEGPLNKLVVSMNNAVDSRPILADVAATRRGPHILVDHTGTVIVLAEPSQACVPHQGQNLRAPYAESPAVWVEFTGTGPDDFEDIDVVGILKSLCEQYGVPYKFPVVADGLARSSFTATEGIVQRKSLRGYSSASVLPIPSAESAVISPTLALIDLPVPEPGPALSSELLEMRDDEPSFPVEEAAAEWPEFKGRPLKLGSKSDKIAMLAEAYGVADVVEFDEELEALVATVQEGAGLDVDGIIDAATWAALNPNS